MSRQREDKEPITVELVKIFLTSGLTIVGGVLVFVLGQVIQKFLLEPVHEQSKAIGEIYFGLVYYAVWCANPGSGKPEDRAAGSDAIRRYASQLQGTTHAIYCYDLFERWGLVPVRQNVDEAVGDLIRISNSIHTGDGRDKRADADHVRNLLAVRERRCFLPWRWRWTHQNPPHRSA
jgi:hypothetical protein